MSDAVTDHPEWTPVLKRGEFHLRVFQRNCPAPIRAKGVFALGVAVRSDNEIFAFNFQSLDGLKQFCREMMPRTLHVDGKSALQDCLPLPGDGGG